MTKEFIIAMTAGASLSDPMSNVQVPDNWYGTEECGDFAYVINQYMDEHQLSYLGIATVESVARKILKDILAGAALPCRPHHDEYDDFARGFLAGQILGAPTYKTLDLVEKAEQIWAEDSEKDVPEYGYYQEVLNEVKETYKELV